jgi:2'-5' RNA ligase
MRLFVSVDLDGLADAVAEAQRPLSGLSGLRLTDPGQAHVTMQFLGKDDHDVGTLVAALERAVADADVGATGAGGEKAGDDGGFEATFEGVGAFPSPEYIRVVWLGVGRGASELSALHRRIEAEATALGYDADDHDFTPHVTLARVDDASSKGAVQSFLETANPEVGPLRVEELRLTESTPTPDGPEYRTVARIDL